jgi:hypothetical protein
MTIANPIYGIFFKQLLEDIYCSKIAIVREKFALPFKSNKPDKNKFCQAYLTRKHLIQKLIDACYALSATYTGSYQAVLLLPQTHFFKQLHR